MQREAFTTILKRLIDTSGISTSILAHQLAISQPAVSQFLHGVTLPSEDHLNAICDILQVPQGVAIKLRRLLDLARLEPKRGRRSLFARNLLAMRTRRDLTHEKLAELIGLAPQRIRQLEANENGVIDSMERIAIREFFGCDPEEFNRPDSPDARFAVAEGNDFGVPLIALDDLIDFHQDDDLLDFADRHFRDFLFRDLSGFRTPVAVRCETAALGGDAGGIVELILSAAPPEKVAMIDLCRYACGDFRLKQHRKAGYLNWLPRLNDHQHEKPEVTLPVQEIALRPATNDERSLS